MTISKDLNSILRAPHITEKGAYLAEKGIYVFDVAPTANKYEISAAIQLVYKITPRQVRVSTIRKKLVRTRGTNRLGATKGGKKAYVYLKAGDVIEFA